MKYACTHEDTYILVTCPYVNIHALLLHYTASHCLTVHCHALQFVLVHDNVFHYMATLYHAILFRWIALHCIALHCIRYRTLHYNIYSVHTIQPETMHHHMMGIVDSKQSIHNMTEQKQCRKKPAIKACERITREANHDTTHATCIYIYIYTCLYRTPQDQWFESMIVSIGGAILTIYIYYIYVYIYVLISYSAKISGG